MKAPTGLWFGLRPLVLALAVMGLGACGGGGDDASPGGSTGTGSAGSGSISSAVAAYAGQYDLVADNGVVVRITVDANGKVTTCGAEIRCSGTLTLDGSQGVSLHVTANVDGDDVSVDATITSGGAVSGSWTAQTEDGPVNGRVNGARLPAGGSNTDTGSTGNTNGPGGSSEPGDSSGSSGKVLGDYAGSYAITGKVDGDSYTVTYAVSMSGSIGSCKLDGESFSCSGSLRVLDPSHATFDIAGRGDGVVFSADGTVDGSGKAAGTFRATTDGETVSGTFAGGIQ